MRIPVCLGAVLLAIASASVAQAQTSFPSLQDADRAFAEALLRHDRAAFVATFAPDAECSLPTVKRGPEAIANSWLPFLIDPGTTMVLTSTRVTIAPSGDVGDSTGTFAIRGRTSNGIQTVPGGAYSIGWRLLDGHWKIVTLSGSGKAHDKPAARGGVAEH